MGNLTAIVLADRRAFDPARCRFHHLVWIVHGEKDAISTDCEKRTDQRLIVEISARCYVEVLAQIILQTFVDSFIRRVVFETALDSPGKIGQRLTQMTENDREIRQPIEEAAVNDA